MSSRAAVPRDPPGIFPAFLELVEEVHRRSPLADSFFHGDHHWRLVAWTGYALMREAPGADALVILLFALFHDSQRESEYDDPEGTWNMNHWQANIWRCS